MFDKYNAESLINNLKKYDILWTNRFVLMLSQEPCVNKLKPNTNIYEGLLISEKEVFCLIKDSPITAYVSGMVYGLLPHEIRKVTHHDSFKEMLKELDLSLRINNNAAIIYTAYCNNFTDTYIIIEQGANTFIINVGEVFIDCLKGKGQTMSMSGKEFKDIRLIKFYNNISEALESPEIISSNNILEEL